MSKKLFIVCSLIITLMFSGNSFAGEIYTAVTNGYYSNPQSGQVEDPGNNPGIGEGMVSNVVGAYSLIEKDDDGRLYATVRYGLRDQIQDIKVWIQSNPNSSFVPVGVQEIENRGETGDFRFEIPSTECMVKSSFFVEPMGRDVIFFLDFSSLEEGNTDFKVSINTTSQDESEQEDSSQEESSQNDSKQNDSKQDASKQDASKQEDSKQEPSVLEAKKEGSNKAEKKLNKIETKGSKQENKQGNKTKTNNNLPNKTSIKMPSSDDKISQADLGYEHGVLIDEDFKDQTSLAESDFNKNEGWGTITTIMLAIVIVIIAIAISIFLLGALIIVIYYKYKKKRNLNIENILDGDDV